MSAPVVDAFGAWFDQRHPRERQWLTLAFAVVVAALLWWILIAPALHTYRASNAAHTQLDTELAQMQELAREARQTRALPVVSAQEAQAWLDASIKKLGKANLSAQGARVQINFAGASPEALSMWLAEARSAAQLLPTQANWKRSASSVNAALPLWDGVMVLELPAK